MKQCCPRQIYACTTQLAAHSACAYTCTPWLKATRRTGLSRKQRHRKATLQRFFTTLSTIAEIPGSCSGCSRSLAIFACVGVLPRCLTFGADANALSEGGRVRKGRLCLLQEFPLALMPSSSPSLTTCILGRFLSIVAKRCALLCDFDSGDILPASTLAYPSPFLRFFSSFPQLFVLHSVRVVTRRSLLSHSLSLSSHAARLCEHFESTLFINCLFTATALAHILE